MDPYDLSILNLFKRPDQQPWLPASPDDGTLMADALESYRPGALRADPGNRLRLADALDSYGDGARPTGLNDPLRLADALDSLGPQTPGNDLGGGSEVPLNQSYTVQPGDSLSGIAARFVGSGLYPDTRTGVGALVHANGLTGSLIRPGQSLSVTPASAGDARLGGSTIAADAAARAPRSLGVPPPPPDWSPSRRPQPTTGDGAQRLLQGSGVDDWKANFNNRYAVSDKAFAIARDLREQRSITKTPSENLALQGYAALADLDGWQKGLSAFPMGLLDTATSLVRDGRPAASPSVQADSDTTATVASLAGIAFNPDLAEADFFDMGPHGQLVPRLKGTGMQANHLNQQAAYGSVIPFENGLSVSMEGNALADIGSPHYQFHNVLETFWNQYRPGGKMYGLPPPTNAEYDAALKVALRQSGRSRSAAADLAAQAARQRATYGLAPSDPVPRIPGRLPQKGPN
jgi:hypothetical protein